MSGPASGDTIVACATPWGRAAISVLRLSGPDALGVARRLCPGPPAWRPRRVSLRRAVDEDRIVDEILAVWMPAPASYTGEDVVELSCHGNPLLVEALLSAAVRAGARPARPGEFTRRALLSGRIDLLRAEAVAERIEARSEAGLALASGAASEELSAALQRIEDRLLDLVAELEARFDTPGEELSHAPDAEVAAGLEALAAQARTLAATWARGRIQLHGARIALVGPVNAGKSSLFNALVGERRALTSPEPGTTRDVVEKTIRVAGLELCFLDTAGERADPGELERQGQELGAALVGDADLLLVVLPLHLPLSQEGAEILARTANRPRRVVGTHADRWTGGASPFLADHHVCSLTGEGIEALRAEVHRAVAGEQISALGALVYTQRQHELLRAVAVHAGAAADALLGVAGPVVAAEEAIAALERLGELRGADVREEVLDRLFARFCIGK